MLFCANCGEIAEVLELIHHKEFAIAICKCNVCKEEIVVIVKEA